MVKIDNVHIQGVGGIYDLYLEFNDGVNVICGANGVGKSTILTSINEFFNRQKDTLKRNAKCECGSIELNFTYNESHRSVTRPVEDFIPEVGNATIGVHIKCMNASPYLLGFNSERDIPYQKINGLLCDPDNKHYDRVNWVEYKDIKNWFINRYTFSDKDDSLEFEHKKNYEIAKKILAY